VSVFGRIPLVPADRSPRPRRLPPHVLPPVRGASVEGVERLDRSPRREFMLQKASPAAIRRIREHRAAGHLTILITAAADIFVSTAGTALHIVIGCELEVRDAGTPGSWRRHRSSARRAPRGSAIRPPGGDRPEAVLRLRRLVLRPAAPARGRQPGRRLGPTRPLYRYAHRVVGRSSRVGCQGMLASVPEAAVR